MDEAERARLLARIRDFLRTRPETSGGEFTLPMVTVALRARRRYVFYRSAAVASAHRYRASAEGPSTGL